MNQQDGVEYLLEAARAIVHEHQRSDIRFVLMGGGSHQPRLARLAGEMGLQPHVTFTGRIPDGEMLQTLRACSICVQPDPSNALNELSTMNKALEYMAMARPTVAFDLHETRVSCADAALYARPNSARDLARKILELADNPELRLRMGRTGQQRILTQLAWPFSVPALLTAYDRARQGAGKPGPGSAGPGEEDGPRPVRRRAERVAARQQVTVHQSP